MSLVTTCFPPLDRFFNSVSLNIAWSCVAEISKPDLEVVVVGEGNARSGGKLNLPFEIIQSLLDDVPGVWASIVMKKDDSTTSIGPFLLNCFVHAMKLSEIA